MNRAARTIFLNFPTMLAAILLAAVSAPAQQRLTLAEATAEALAKSDLLRAEDARVAGAASAVAAARGNLLPTITFEERFLATDNPAYDFSMKINQGNFTPADLQGAPGTFNNPDPIGDFQTSVTLVQPIYSRRATLGVALARAEAGAVSLDRERRREEVAHQVLQAWLGSQAAEAYRETAMRAEEDAVEHLRLAGVAEAAGTGLVSDRLRAEVALAEARRMRLTVENDLEIARRGLGLAVGREEALAPADSGPVVPPPDLETLIAGAGRRADLRALETRVSNARRAGKLAGAARFPEVGLTGSLQANDPDVPFGTAGTSYMVGLGVTWRLFDGFRTRSAEAQAEAGARQAESLLAAMTKEARFRVREAWLRLQEAQAGIAIAERAQAAAEEGVRLVRVRYENGLAPMVTLLDAQSALNKARSDAARAHAGAASALGEVLFRAGAVPANAGARS
ncbi:MAG: TolC family protein [Candidatus Methylomirabilia bacterium]